MIQSQTKVEWTRRLGCMLCTQNLDFLQSYSSCVEQHWTEVFCWSPGFGLSSALHLLKPSSLLLPMQRLTDPTMEPYMPRPHPNCRNRHTKSYTRPCAASCQALEGQPRPYSYSPPEVDRIWTSQKSEQDDIPRILAI